MKRTAITRRTPLQRSGKLRPMSAKRQREARIYAKKRKEFLAENTVCWVWARLMFDHEFEVMREIWGDGFDRAKPSSEVHHVSGRVGANYLDETKWMACSLEGHRFLHNNPKIAREKGWLV